MAAARAYPQPHLIHGAHRGVTCPGLKSNLVVKSGRERQIPRSMSHTPVLHSDNIQMNSLKSEHFQLNIP